MTTHQKKTALRSKLRAKTELFDRKKDEAAVLSADIKLLQSDILDLLDEAGLKSFSYDEDDAIRVKATRVQATSLVFDEPKLKKALGAAEWGRVTTKVLDTSKLESEVAEGRVDPMTLAECSEEKENAPYVKVSKKLSKNGDEEKEPSAPVAVSNRRGRKRRGLTS